MNDEEYREMLEFKKRNFKERLKFIDSHVEWLKSHSNKEWSRQQKKFLDK